jgi:choline dehydrogenase
MIAALNLDTTTYNYFTLICWNILPESRGSVNIVSTDPLTPPELDASFYQTNGTLNSDINVAIQSIFFINSVVNSLNTTIGSNVYNIVYPKAADIDIVNPNKLIPYILGELSVTDHPSGTCKMDAYNTTASVVNDRLFVRGVDGLMCADLSIYPLIPDGNTCMGAYFVGGKATEFLTGLTYNNANPF